MELKELLLGQKTRIRSNDYFSTEAYVTPFIERMSKYTDQFIYEAVPASQVSVNPDGSENMIYNKVHVEAILPGGEEISESMGFTYALDARKPVVRFYKAWKRNDTGCLLLNDDNFIHSQDLEPETTINYKAVEQLLEKQLDYSWIEKIQQTSWKATNDEVNYRLGQWIRFAINFFINSEYGKVKIATNDIVNGYKKLFETSSSNFFKSLGTDCINYEMLSAFSTVLYENKKDPVNLIVKTRLLNSILSL